MRHLLLLASASCGAVLVAGHAAAQSTAESSGSEVSRPPIELETVVVTASRRSESIREVPTAVSAYGEEKLREAQIASLEGLVVLTPNVQISTYLTNANIAIRGIGSGNFIQAGGEPGVAVHQNGVYLGQSALAVSTFLDVQRVEILRGPQGTLFGRNATGGAINIIPQGPTGDLSYGFDVSGGFDPGMVRSSGYVSGPLDSSGALLGRLSIGQNYNQGYSRNRASDGPSRLDGRDDVAVRGQLEWAPTGDFDVRLVVDHQRNKDAGTAIYLLGTPTGAPVVFPVPGAPIALAPEFPTGDPERRDAYANIGLRDMEAKSVALIAGWSVGAGRLTATLSYNDSDNRIAQDGDGTSIPFTQTRFHNEADQRYGELLYASDRDRPFSYVIGANWYDEHFVQNNEIPTMGYPLYQAGGVIDTESYAAFAHVQYVLPSSTRIFGGLRYSHDTKDMREYLNFRAFFGLPTTNQGRKSWSKVTYEIGASHDFSTAVTGYAKYATGYKSGGYSVSSFNPAFDPETNRNAEIGLKGAFLDGAVQANIAAFHMKYNDLQVNQVQGLVSAVTNAAKATVNGAEIEAVIRPATAWRIEATGSWLDARFDSFSTLDSSRPGLGVLDLSGNRLPSAPRYAANLGVFYDLPISAGTLTLGGRFDWKSRLYFSEFNIPISAQKAVGKLDLFVNFKSADERWTASLFALNATDRSVRANVVVVSDLLGSLALAQQQPGRQVGVSVGYHF